MISAGGFNQRLTSLAEMGMDVERWRERDGIRHRCAVMMIDQYDSQQQVDPPYPQAVSRLKPQSHQPNGVP